MIYSKKYGGVGTSNYQKPSFFVEFVENIRLKQFRIHLCPKLVYPKLENNFLKNYYLV
jgi:hypothetical protein